MIEMNKSFHSQTKLNLSKTKFNHDEISLPVLLKRKSDWEQEQK